MRNDFGVIIISHGRPECETVKTLRASGYSGNIYIVVDDEDKTKNEYIRLYGDHVHIFHKTDDFDLGDLGGPKGVATYARNEVLKVARKYYLKYYLHIDDDLKSLSYRYNDNGHLRGQKIRNFDKLIEAICEYLDNTNVDCIGFGNAVDYIGGVSTFESQNINRLVMNGYILRTENEVKWRGRYSEDTIHVVSESTNGRIYFRFIPVQQLFDVWLPKRKSNNSGGCIATYNEVGSYKLRFYAVMFCPSCVIVRESASGFDNTTKTDNAFPKILSSRYKKGQ